MHSHLLLFFQILAHFGLIFLALFGNANDWIVCLVVYFFTGCWGMSVTYHRLLSHKSFRTNKFLKCIGILLGTIGLTGSALAWTSIHRQHHSAADKERDPHSPNIQKWWRVQFFSMYYKPNLRFSRDLLKDKFIVKCHRYYFHINIIYACLLLFLHPFLIISAYLAPAAILWHGGSFINTIGHKWGYRTFKVLDKSVNNPLLGLFMFGEGWHNNHHAKPYKKSFSNFWWEIDISSLLIKIIERTPSRNWK